jgi:hypothetical protein
MGKYEEDVQIKISDLQNKKRIEDDGLSKMSVVGTIEQVQTSCSIKVLLLLFSVLAKPEYGVKVKLAISVAVRNSKTTKLVF